MPEDRAPPDRARRDGVAAPPRAASKKSGSQRRHNARRRRVQGRPPALRLLRLAAAFAFGVRPGDWR